MRPGGVGSAGCCRVCVGAAEDGRDLFDGPDASCMRDAITALFNFQVKPTDCSTIICSKCAHIIGEFYAYYLQVKRAQIYFENADEEFDITYKNSTEIGSEYKQNLEIAETIAHVSMQNYSHIKTEGCSEVYESNDKNDLGRLLSGSDPQEDGERDIKMDVDDFDSFKTSLDLNYQNDDDSIFESEQVSIEEMPENKPSRVAMKKCKSNKRCKSLKSNDYLENNAIKNEQLRDHKISNNDYEFPSELFKNGKLIIKGSVLEELISKFYNIECDLCHDHPRFKNVESMLTHYNSEHGARGYLICCNTHLYQHRAIYMHMARHLQPSAFECPICKKILSRPHSLKPHLQTHLPETEKPHKCNECNKRFRLIEALKSHKITHIPIEERKRYDCKICGKIFTLPSSFATHMNSGHSAVKYLCSECGRSFKKQTELTQHMLTHDTSGKNEIQCQHCGFMCKNLPTYKIHLKLHLGERLHCTLCDYNTHRRSQLNGHMRIRHSNEKPHTCVICNKQFKLKSALKFHMPLHTGERKYTCNFCPKTFAAPGNYHSHRKKDHPEEHRNETIMRQKKKFREIPKLDVKDPSEKESKVHEMAREYLQKIADQNRKRKNEEK